MSDPAIKVTDSPWQIVLSASELLSVTVSIGSTLVVIVLPVTTQLLAEVTLTFIPFPSIKDVQLY